MITTWDKWTSNKKYPTSTIFLIPGFQRYPNFVNFDGYHSRRPVPRTLKTYPSVFEKFPLLESGFGPSGSELDIDLKWKEILKVSKCRKNIKNYDCFCGKTCGVCHEPEYKRYIRQRFIGKDLYGEEVFHHCSLSELMEKRCQACR